MRNKKETIVGIILAVAIILGIGYKYYESTQPPQLTETIAVEQLPQQLDVPLTADQVDIIRTKPISPTRYGVIEVGASGFNSFIIDADKDDNWEMVDKQFGESLAYEGFATTDDVKNGLKKYLTNMFNKGVAGKNAHFVMSSGALKNPKTEMIAKSIEQMGYVVNRVTADQEGKFAMKSQIPTDELNKSVSVDIGSGNTKITWYENGRAKSVETFGAKFYQNKTSESEVYSTISDIMKKIPTSNKENIYFIGGVPFQLAKESKVGENRFTVLSNPDKYSFGDDIKLKSGLVIYKAIYDNADDNSKMIFDWDSNFTVGFLLNLN